MPRSQNRRPALIGTDGWDPGRPRPFQSICILPLQVPLVASLFVADRQLGRPLFRRDSLAHGRAGAPQSVSCRMAVGLPLKDDRTIPDTAEAIFEHASRMLTLFSLHEANGQPMLGRGAEIELQGTIGTLYVAGDRYEIVPEPRGAFQDPKPNAARQQVVKGSDGDLDQQAARDFLDCVKSRKRPNADVEEGHRSTTFAHLANIALSTRARLEWDAQTERFTNSEQANQLLHYGCRRCPGAWREPESDS